MTDLLDRLKNPDQDGLGIPQDKEISNHFFSGMITLATLGIVTRQNIIDTYTLVGDEIIQLDAIIAVYQGKPNAAQKSDYQQTFIAGSLVREAGFITKVQFQNLLEI